MTTITKWTLEYAVHGILGLWFIPDLVVYFFSLLFVLHSTYRIEAVALIDWIFVIRFQFVECDHMKYGEEYQECIRYQCNDVGDRREIERHRESKFVFGDRMNLETERKIK